MSAPVSPPVLPEAHWRLTLPVPLPGKAFDVGSLSTALLKAGQDSLQYGGVSARLSLDVQLSGEDHELLSDVTFIGVPEGEQRDKAEHLLRCDAQHLAWRQHLVWPATPTGGDPNMEHVQVIAAEVNWPAFGQFVNTARVEVYLTPGRREAICVLCDGPWNEGTSTINAASALAQHLYRTFLPEHAPGADVRFLDAQTLDVPSEETPRYAWLTFHDQTELTGASWRYASHAEIEALIGQSDWRQHRTEPRRAAR